MQFLPKQRSDLYGQFAFSAVVLAAFAQFVITRRVTGEAWQLFATFGLGALYAMLGVMSDSLFIRRGRHWKPLYFVFQILCVGALLTVSPINGFLGIVALPITSQAIFDLHWRPAIAIGVLLFAMCVATWWVPYGRAAGFEAMISYSSAFIFTIVFSFVTRQAVEAKCRAYELTTKLEAANTQLRAHAEQAEELATTRERNRLAREIHDGIGHYLTTIHVQLEAARAVLSTQPAQAATALENAARLSQEALDDVRRSVGTLRTDRARPPLPDALQTLVRDAGLPVTLSVRGAPRTLAPAVEHALFRSAQEGLTNIRKHSAATQAELTLDFLAPTRVALTVADNGRGATAAPTDTTGGYGLRGIRERLDLLGGSVATTNRPAGGFSLSVEVPA